MYPYTYIYISHDGLYIIFYDGWLCLYNDYNGDIKMHHYIPYIDIAILYPMYIIRNHVLCVYDPMDQSTFKNS